MLGSPATAIELPWPLSPHHTARDTRTAQSIAKAVWARVLVPCGKNRVFALEGKDHSPQVFRKYKFHFETTADDLTPADHLNGTDWRGDFYVNASVFRNYRFDSTKDDLSAGHWEPWQDNFTDSAQAGYRLRKFQGRWEINDITQRNGAYQPLDLNALTTWRVSCGDADAPFISAP
jgi:hypothetical protein